MKLMYSNLKFTLSLLSLFYYGSQGIASENATSSLSRVPDEVIFKVASFLPMEDSIQLFTVDKYFRSNASVYLKRSGQMFDLRQSHTEQALLSGIFAQVRKFKIDTSQMNEEFINLLPQNIESLSISFPREIRHSFNLSGLELVINRFNNLKELELNIDFDWNRDKTFDLKRLSLLKNLTHLKIVGLEVLDLDSLSSFQNLTSLTLIKASITNDQLHHLFGLTNLKSLNLRDNPLTAITDIHQLKDLEELDLSLTNIQSLNPITSLLKLKSLAVSMGGRWIPRQVDYNPISAMKDLEYLELEHCIIHDLNFLSPLKKLKHLSLHDSRISNINREIGILSSLPSLEFLGLGYVNFGGSEQKISNITPLLFLTQLKELNLNQSEVSNIGSLASLTKLQKIQLYDTRVTEIGPLSFLKELRSINLSTTKVSDLRPISSLGGLEELYLNSTLVSDLSPLSSLTNLKSLGIRSTKIFDHNVLIQSLTGSYFSALKPLSSLVNLEHLDLSFSKVSDLTPLSSLINLKSLHIDYTKVSSVKPLFKLHKLKRIYSEYTYIKDLDQLSKKRPGLKVGGL